MTFFFYRCQSERFSSGGFWKNWLEKKKKKKPGCPTFPDIADASYPLWRRLYGGPVHCSLMSRFECVSSLTSSSSSSSSSYFFSFYLSLPISVRLFLRFSFSNLKETSVDLKSFPGFRLRNPSAGSGLHNPGSSLRLSLIQHVSGMFENVLFGRLFQRSWNSIVDRVHG